MDQPIRRKPERNRPLRRSGPMEDKVYDEPSEIDAVDGRVVLDGPNGVAVLMTPAAAEETSERLLFGAAKAQGQIVRKRGREDFSADQADGNAEGAS